MTQRIFTFLFVLSGLVFVFPAEAALNCSSYGTSYADTYNGGKTGGQVHCPAVKPINNSKATSPAGSHCCMTQASSDKLNADSAKLPAVSPTPGGNCPVACIDINTNCPSGTSRAQKICPSSTVKCCLSPAQAGTADSEGNGESGATGGSNGTEISINVSNPLKYDTVEGVLTSIMGGIKGIVVTLALLMIVLGGVMYVLSFGNPENIKRAKALIFGALIGLAIVIAAPAFLREISALLGWDNAPAIEGGTTLTLTQIARNILNFLLAVIGILALIMMIISGIMYITSVGNDTRMKQARAIFTASLIGIAIAMASLILVSTVARFFA